MDTYNLIAFTSKDLKDPYRIEYESTNTESRRHYEIAISMLNPTAQRVAIEADISFYVHSNGAVVVLLNNEGPHSTGQHRIMLQEFSNALRNHLDI